MKYNFRAYLLCLALHRCAFRCYAYCFPLLCSLVHGSCQLFLKFECKVRLYLKKNDFEGSTVYLYIIKYENFT